MYVAEANLMSTHNHYYVEDLKDIPRFYPFTNWHDVMINLDWLQSPVTKCLFL